MSFLAPFFLLLGAAAAVPLLIHLLRRHIGTRVDFPAARYLARAEQEHSRSLRLRNLLLMVLRVAIVLALALAAARPMTRLAGGGHTPTALAIVLDNSLSTTVVQGGRPVLDALRVRARAVADAASSGDQLWLVTADGRTRGGSGAVVAEAIAGVDPLAGAGDLANAVARAAAVVRGSALEARQIVVVTDGQRSAWRSRPDVGDVPVLLSLAGGELPPNRAVAAVEPRPTRWTPRGTLAARLATTDSATYRVSLGERTLVRGAASPGEEVVVRAAPPERGWVAGTVELEPDELPGDDVRHFALWIGPAPNIAVGPGAGTFVASAVDVLRAAGRVGAAPGAVSAGGTVSILSADELGSLPAILIAPRDPVRIGAANRALERANVPWRFGTATRGDASVSPASRYPDVSVALRYALLAQPGAVAETLAVVGRDPWIVAGPRYVVIGSPIDPATTSFPIRAAFVQWIAEQVTERLAGEPGGVLRTTPGAQVKRPLWADAITFPDQPRTALADSFAAPTRAGTYFLDRGGRRVGAIVVDPEPEESNLQRATTAELRARIDAARVELAKDTDLPRLAYLSAARRGLIVPMLLAALVLLILESLLVRPAWRARPA